MLSYSMRELLSELAQTPSASDLIITEGKPPQIRVSNLIVPLDFPVMSQEDTRELCFSMLTSEQAEIFKNEKELDLSYYIPDVGRFRVNIYCQRGAPATAIRLVNERVPDFEELRLPAVIRKLAMLPRGLVLITGPVGSGKSTTVASMVDHINKMRRCHIVCIEDPIEYVHAHSLSTVDQREVGNDTHSFHEALRRVLRQSPDVIVIGEIRDRESAQAAITLAETGHLTLTTLHTRGSISSINRLIDMFPAEQILQVRNQLASSLAGVVWQQLLPKRRGSGLVVACEIMTVTPAIRALIRQGRNHEILSVLQSGKKYEMCTMEQSIEELIQEDLIDTSMLLDGMAEFSTASN
jgi:twitching motility protein PilT